MTPELINLMSWMMTETAKICKCVYNMICVDGDNKG